MPERQTVSQVVQLGVETTPGTVAAANRKLQALSIETSISAESDVFTPIGNKYPALVALNQEWTEADLAGEPTYSELIYPFSSLVTTAATVTQIMDGVTPTGAYTWTFTPSTSAPDTPKTYTIEQGSSVRAHRFTHGLVTEFTIDIGRDDISISGSMIGQRMTDGITLTASPTTIELQPILPSQVTVFLDTTSGALGTTKFTRALTASVSIGDRYNPVWVLDASQTSWITYVEGVPTAEATLMLEADSNGMVLLDRLRDGLTRFLRIQAVGPNIYTNGGVIHDYRFRFDAAVKISDVGDYSDEDGLYAIEFTAAIMHDSTWGKAFTIELINKVSAL